MEFRTLVYSALKASCLLLLLTGTLVYGQDDGPPPPDGPPPQSDTATPPKRPDVDHVIAQMSRRYKLTAEQQTQLKPVLLEEWNKISSLQQDTSLSLTERNRRIKAMHQETSSKIAEIFTKSQYEKFEEDQAKIQEHNQQGDDPNGPPPPPPDGGAGGPPPPM
jgi:hypothetical protein